MLSLNPGARAARAVFRHLMVISILFVYTPLFTSIIRQGAPKVKPCCLNKTGAVSAKNRKKKNKIKDKRNKKNHITGEPL